jgi:hypothetical protein
MAASLREALFWGAVVACLVAQGAITRSTLRVLRTAPTAPGGLAADASPASASDPRRRPLPPQRRAAELAWLLLPAVALTWLFVAGWPAMRGTP